MKALESYTPFARKLSFQYPFYGSGADEQDVYQVAMMAAWIATRDEPDINPRFVHHQMRLRVIDFTRLRQSSGQRRFERETELLPFELDGPDSTWDRVLVKEELERTVVVFKSLPAYQQKYLSGHINGVPHEDIAPDRKVQTVDLGIMLARKQIIRELAA